MAAFMAIPSYFLGTACIGRGLMAIYRPRSEYSHVGLLLEGSGSPPTDARASSGTVSPLMFFKGIREISYGLGLVLLQRQGARDALTTFAAILSFVRFGDGTVVWLCGGEELRYRAWGHWITGAGFAGWAIWRFCSRG